MIPQRSPAQPGTRIRLRHQVLGIAQVDGKAAGIFVIADPVKQSTPEALQALHAEGVEIVMLTGDNRTTAEAIGRRLGIDRIEADVLPERKAQIVAALKDEEGREVHSEKVVEVVFRGGKPVRNGDQFGVGCLKG